MITDKVLIVKYKAMGWTDSKIASKMGLTVEQVAAKSKSIDEDLKASDSSGYSAFCELFTIMAGQYQLLGASLAQVATTLGNPVLSEQFAEFIVPGNVQATLDNLRKHCIILHAHKPSTPEEQMKFAMEKN